MSFNSDDILDLQNIGVRKLNVHSDISIVKNNPTVVQKSSRRWLVLFSFSFIIILNMFNLNEYFDIEEALRSFYDKNFTFNNLKKTDSSYWQELFNLLVYLTFLLPAMFLVQVKGIWFSCIIGIILTTFGCWIKCASVKTELFVFLFFGQLMCAIAQAFIQTPIVKISASWFGFNETATATAVI